MQNLYGYQISIEHVNASRCCPFSLSKKRSLNYIGKCPRAENIIMITKFLIVVLSYMAVYISSSPIESSHLSLKDMFNLFLNVRRLPINLSCIVVGIGYLFTFFWLPAEQEAERKFEQFSSRPSSLEAYSSCRISYPYLNLSTQRTMMPIIKRRISTQTKATTILRTVDSVGRTGGSLKDQQMSVWAVSSKNFPFFPDVTVVRGDSKYFNI